MKLKQSDILLLVAEVGDWGQFQNDSDIERWLHESIHEEYLQVWKVIIRKDGRKTASHWKLVDRGGKDE